MPQDEESEAAPDESRGKTRMNGAESANSAGDEINSGLALELSDLKDRYLRLAADFENFKRRALKERSEYTKYAAEIVLKDLVEVLDNLERALTTAERSADFESLREGMAMIHRQARQVLEKHGVREVESLHQPFDPSIHEALSQIESDTHPANTVTEVHQKGYQLHDRLLRPARVVVAKAE